MHVRAPASSANLGPGFDCLGLALDLPFELATAASAPEAFLEVEPTHPAAVAFVAAGGSTEAGLRWRSPIPSGRGLGFSGAARVAGAYLAGLVDGLDHDAARDGAYVVATDLEGHPDNAAASAYGGFTVAVEDRVVSLPVPPSLRVVVWSPEGEVSTDRSRLVLADAVSLPDATFSVGRAALWVAALAAGDLAALRTACQDRLHQPGRLVARPDSASVLEHLLGVDAVLAAWLSGSGPTIAALIDGEVELGALPAPGRVQVLEVARDGVGAAPFDS